MLIQIYTNISCTYLLIFWVSQYDMHIYYNGLLSAGDWKRKIMLAAFFDYMSVYIREHLTPKWQQTDQKWIQHGSSYGQVSPQSCQQMSMATQRRRM
ncbi:hypothetical protein EUGRSUZ_G02862 [Eucalyptus grandis]|uniref:Uncharacterized protein n=2 Tax=Eucalyptus grandis TaxID=71139 RepID=A0ACC3K870_EUCGR|nr:hypothetical protein EUGRSUZ_G02862 [Eucalyptus grandis]